MFETQKALFSMRQSEAYRDALLETAHQLLKAPDEVAETRVEPDMMLMQIKLSDESRSPEDNALEVARFADRYRGTPAEAQSLMMAAVSAFDLGNRDLLDAFRKTLSVRFSNDPVVTAFMRERFAAGGEIHLPGAFKRADGKWISFPLGQPYVVCFWSLDTPLLKEKAAEVKALQNRYKGQFKVYSFNLDEQRDGAEGALKRMKLDWIPMVLPGGTENPTYVSVGGANRFAALVIGPHGLATMKATRSHPASLAQRYEANVESPRIQALLRSLSIGEYLVTDTLLPGQLTLAKEALEEQRARGRSPERTGPVDRAEL
jgi:hypothetical protein